MIKRALSPARRNAVEGVLAAVEILQLGSEEAAVYAKALHLLNASGIGVSLFDLLIGVQAAAIGAVLVSHDGIFPRIAKLTGIKQIVEWASEV